MARQSLLPILEHPAQRRDETGVLVGANQPHHRQRRFFWLRNLIIRVRFSSPGHTISGVGADKPRPSVRLSLRFYCEPWGMRILESMDQLCRRPVLVVVDLVIPITKNIRPKK